MSSEIPQAAMDFVPALDLSRRPLQLENNIPGKVFRRSRYCLRYLLALSHRDAIRQFQPIVERCFEHDWLGGATVKLRFIPGHEERELRIPWPGDKALLCLRWMPWRDEDSPARWCAPIAVTVFKKGKDGGKREVVRYMAVFIKNRILHITQLQGVPLIEMPKGLRDWAERFVKATMDFARAANFRGVWIAPAESLYSYHHPWVSADATQEVRDRERSRIRSNLVLHHNQTAMSLGFQPDQDWFTWQNPAYRAR